MDHGRFQTVHQPEYNHPFFRVKVRKRVAENLSKARYYRS